MVISWYFDCIILVCNPSARVECSSCIYWISIHLTGVCLNVPCETKGKSRYKLITFLFYLVPDFNLTVFPPCKSANSGSITLKLFTSVQDQDKALGFMVGTPGLFLFSPLNFQFSVLGIPTVFYHRTM